MDLTLLQLLRFIHIVSGAFWVGTAVTLAFFVFPALLAGETSGGRYLKQIMMQRKLAPVITVAMLLVILSGGYLWRLDFPHISGGTFDRRTLDYTLGAFLGILAAIVGLFVNMPTGMKLGAVVDSIGTGVPSVESSEQAARLSRKLLIATRCIAILLLGAVSLMALARYAR